MYIIYMYRVIPDVYIHTYSGCDLFFVCLTSLWVVRQLLVGVLQRAVE